MRPGSARATGAPARDIPRRLYRVTGDPASSARHGGPSRSRAGRTEAMRRTPTDRASPPGRALARSSRCRSCTCPRAWDSNSPRSPNAASPGSPGTCARSAWSYVGATSPPWARPSSIPQVPRVDFRARRDADETALYAVETGGGDRESPDGARLADDEGKTPDRHSAQSLVGVAAADVWFVQGRTSGSARKTPKPA